ncbi:hypothetical protein ACH4HG_38175 [Streptomyces coeruleorubidus]|uniref:hypothetical protein n=1 Tax=Streptomyces coeruleorubidus TaxID=116188 RepID=UPI00378EA621
MVGEQLFQRRTASRVRPDSQVAASLDEVEGHEVRRLLPRRLSGGCPAPGEPLLQPLECQPVPLPHHQLTVDSGVRRQLRQGRRPVSGNEAVMSVPRRERSSTRPPAYTAS